MNNDIKYKKLPDSGAHNCFGCSPSNPSGLKMKFFANDQSIVSYLSVPDHLGGWNRLVHGGVISTMLDEIMSWSAIYLLKKITLTKSMTVDFIKPVYTEQALRVEGKILEIVSRHEAVVSGLLYNKKEELCAKSNGIFALLSPQISKRLGIMDDDALRSLEPLLNAQ